MPVGTVSLCVVASRIASREQSVLWHRRSACAKERRLGLLEWRPTIGCDALAYFDWQRINRLRRYVDGLYQRVVCLSITARRLTILMGQPLAEFLELSNSRRFQKCESPGAFFGCSL